LDQAGVEPKALCQHYRVDALMDLSPRDAARARRALTKKIEAQVSPKTFQEAC
jgi:hypothetical protein